MSEQRAREWYKARYQVTEVTDRLAEVLAAYAASEVARVREQTLRECLEMKPSEIAAAIRALPTEEQ